MSNLYQQYLQNPAILSSVSEEFLASKVSDFPLDSGYKALLALKQGGETMHSLSMHCNDRLLRTQYIPSMEDGMTGQTTDLEEQTMEDNVVMNEKTEEPKSEKIVSNVEERMPEQEPQKTEQPPAEEENSPEAIVPEKEIVALTSTKGKKKNKQKNKFRLREYSGISPFGLWLLSFKEGDLEKKLRKEEKAAKKRALEESARKSVTQTVEIVSEPLADILAAQGHLDAAKKMYTQLMQKYPEKSSYFAGKIDQILKNT